MASPKNVDAGVKMFTQTHEDDSIITAFMVGRFWEKMTVFGFV